MAAVDHRSTNITNKTQHQTKMTDYACMLDILLGYLYIFYRSNYISNVRSIFLTFKRRSDATHHNVQFWSFVVVLAVI